MKAERQSAIVEIIRGQAIETQEELARALAEQGYGVTQATVSRDIKEIKLVKKQAGSGRYHYALPDTAEQGIADRFIRIFRESVLSLTSAGHIIILKTLSGSANAAAEAVDALTWSEIAGCIAGDNTIFIAIQDGADIREVNRKFRQIMRN